MNGPKPTNYAYQASSTAHIPKKNKEIISNRAFTCARSPPRKPTPPILPHYRPDCDWAEWDYDANCGATTTGNKNGDRSSQVGHSQN
ncbi:unnamed protein product [Linum trigynum]|uniref:Uncharacterized protein n=1 Tax=Linum trigynum TaxID=586398 RepID=A0AAV2DCJ3_9ROSI